MIRINLLAVERDGGRRHAALESGQKIAIACSVILIVTALAIGWWYWSLRQASARLDTELAAAQQEIERLRAVLDRVEEFEARRAQLQQRVVLIEQLRQGQGAPVRMLDQVSRSLPDGLWLTELTEEDAAVTLDGLSITLTALSDFVANLEGSGYFAPPVEILDSQVEPQPQGEVVRFSVRAQFVPPPLP